ncbi:hypothetical protein LTR27_001446 [Elasticomyces elasticus]|nr:hypothetical protein LTR27_001446 [Elasticomyces elasticus]
MTENTDMSNPSTIQPIHQRFKKQSKYPPALPRSTSASNLADITTDAESTANPGDLHERPSKDETETLEDGRTGFDEAIAALGALPPLQSSSRRWSTQSGSYNVYRGRGSRSTRSRGSRRGHSTSRPGHSQRDHSTLLSSSGPLGIATTDLATDADDEADSEEANSSDEASKPKKPIPKPMTDREMKDHVKEISR